MEVTRYDKLLFDKLTYEKPENQSNVYFGPMYYNQTPLLIQSSRLLVKEIRDDSKHKYLVLETDNSDFSFYDKLVELDDYNLDQTYQKSQDWFNKELPMDILENMYKRITVPFKKNELPTIEFKLPFFKGNLQTKLYDQTNNMVDISTIKPGTMIIAMIHIRGLKFLKQNYYCDLQLSQLKIVKEPVVIQPGECLIVDDNHPIDEKYDYEIVDEEILIQNKKIQELEEEIKLKKQAINSETEELHNLEENLRNLK